MTAEQPFISVIIPVLNNAGTLPVLLQALDRLDYPHRETIVVDNGSTDDTPLIARQYGATVVEERDALTSYGARNRGVRESRGELLAFTDGDCVPQPGWLSDLVTGLEDPANGISVGEIVAYDTSTPVARLTDEVGIMAHAESLDHKQLQSASTANMLVRRTVWEQLGGFDETMPAFGDMEFCWRMQLRLGLRVSYQPQAVVKHQHRTTYRALWRQARRHGWGSAAMHHRYPGQYALSGSENSSRISGLLREIFIGTPGPDRWHRPRFLFTWYAGLFVGYTAARWLGWHPTFRYQPGSRS